MCIADLVSSVESLFPDRFKPNLCTTMYKQCLQQILKLILSSRIEELWPMKIKKSVSHYQNNSSTDSNQIYTQAIYKKIYQSSNFS